MQIERTDDGWIVRVPGSVVEALGLHDRVRVTLRPVPRREDESRHFMAELRQRFPDYPFDREDWDGVDVSPSGDGDATRGGWSWSTKPAGSPEDRMETSPRSTCPNP